MSYPVLSIVSNGYPRLKDRLPTCYSPVRHGIATIRLACIRHAASVNPEPGSNSPKKFIFVCFYFSFLLILLKELLVCNSCSSYIVFKDLVLHGFVSRAFSLYLILKTCQQLFYSFLQIFFVNFLPIYNIYVDKKEKSPSLIE